MSHKDDTEEESNSGKDTSLTKAHCRVGCERNERDRLSLAEVIECTQPELNSTMSPT